MREKRFIALVNLYLDEEISPRQLKALQNAVVKSEKRRRLFNAYKRMDWGIAVSEFQREDVIPFEAEASSRRSRVIYYAGLFTTAAAACAIFGFSISRTLFVEPHSAMSEAHELALAAHAQEMNAMLATSQPREGLREVPLNQAKTVSFQTLVDYSPFEKKPSEIRLKNSDNKNETESIDDIVYRPFNYKRTVSNHIKNWNPGGVRLVQF